MVYREFMPAPELRAYIDAYWYADGRQSTVFTSRILPDGCMDIIYNLGEESKDENGSVVFRHEKVYLVGTMTRYIDSHITPGVMLIGIRFKPGAFLHFYKFSSLHEITNTTIEFDRKQVPEIHLHSKNLVHALNRFFTHRLDPVRLLISPLIDLVKKQQGNIRVEDLGLQSHMTPRRLERHFKTCLGISPKEFIGFARYEAALKTIRARPAGKSLLEIAVDHGYYDHAHLSNEIKKYTGRNPSEL